MEVQGRDEPEWDYLGRCLRREVAQLCPLPPVTWPWVVQCCAEREMERELGQSLQFWGLHSLYEISFWQ